MPLDRGTLAALLDDAHVRSISRRYFISNGFDGTLTSVGIAMGAYLSGIQEGTVVFAIGMGAAVGLGTSGVWSVWEIERAEKRAEIVTLERAMLTDLDDTRIQRRQLGARAINAVASGIGPVIGIVLPLLPFLLVPSIPMPTAVVAALATGVSVLFVFGAFMASVAGLNPVVAGARMGLAGLVVALINLLLPGGTV